MIVELNRAELQSLKVLQQAELTDLFQTRDRYQYMSRYVKTGRRDSYLFSTLEDLSLELGGTMIVNPDLIDYAVDEITTLLHNRISELKKKITKKSSVQRKIKNLLSVAV
jgi:hypothetical protein